MDPLCQERCGEIWCTKRDRRTTTAVKGRAEAYMSVQGGAGRGGVFFVRRGVKKMPEQQIHTTRESFI